MAVDTWLDSNQNCHLTISISTDRNKTFLAQFHTKGEAKDWFKTFMDSTATPKNKQKAWAESEPGHQDFPGLKQHR